MLYHGAYLNNSWFKILIFSVMAPWHLRVLEAYYNGNNLVVRSTPLYDIREKMEDDDFLQNLTRWWFGDYGGETRVLPVNSEHSDWWRVWKNAGIVAWELMDSDVELRHVIASIGMRIKWNNSSNVQFTCQDMKNTIEIQIWIERPV